MLAAVVGGRGAVRFQAVGVCVYTKMKAAFKNSSSNWTGFGSLREPFF